MTGRGSPHVVLGALWMGGALLSFSAMAISVRELLPSMGTFEILTLRSLVSLLLVLALVPKLGIASLRTSRLGLHIFRNVLHFTGQYGWVYAIAMLPLATVFAIEFTMPVWVAVLAVLFLGERLNQGRIVMLVLGLAGILIILRPGLTSPQPAMLAMLLGSFLYASTNIVTKRLAQTDTALTVVFYMAAVQLPLALLPALPSWVAPRLADVPWIVLIGTAGLTAHFCLTRAFAAADASLVVPIDFLRLPLIAVVGSVLYGEGLDVLTFVGAAVIMAGTYYSIRRETLALSAAGGPQ